ncbi:prepilin-type cleavage/methylation domain-containing protein [Cyanosarcina cf. burmensis CCALA 770]|nr:prepilin-type cleavage/methylation domain-containing protein [Cyanosarcina cf. burmensis CCALA 770]
MKSDLKVKYLQFLLGKKKDGNEGFTLIELLVVVIIIGVLAAVALPNLLAQVGKARETEAKTALGSMNRAQQSYYMEKQKFYVGTDIPNALGVAPGTKFYTFNNSTTATNASGTGLLKANFTADAVNPANNGTRDYASGVEYQNGTFSTILCVALAKDATAGTATAAADGVACNTASDPIQ